MKTFSQEFLTRLAMLKIRSKAAGTNLTQLCKDSGVSRSTPERWAKRIPKSIVVVDMIFAELEKLERQQEKDRLAMKGISPRERDRLKAVAAERERAKANKTAN